MSSSRKKYLNTPLGRIATGFFGQTRRTYIIYSTATDFKNVFDTLCTGFFKYFYCPSSPHCLGGMVQLITYRIICNDVNRRIKYNAWEIHRFIRRVAEKYRLTIKTQWYNGGRVENTKFFLFIKIQQFVRCRKTACSFFPPYKSVKNKNVLVLKVILQKTKLLDRKHSNKICHFFSKKKYYFKNI